MCARLNMHMQRMAGTSKDAEGGHDLAPATHQRRVKSAPGTGSNGGLLVARTSDGLGTADINVDVPEAADSAPYLPPSFAPRSQAQLIEEPAATPSRDTLEEIFTNTPATVLMELFRARCECDEEFRKEYGVLIGPLQDVGVSKENRPPPRQGPKRARANSQDLCKKRFLERHMMVDALMCRSDATPEQQHAARRSRHFRQTIRKDPRGLIKVCIFQSHACVCVCGLLYLHCKSCCKTQLPLSP
jgi:hypothetical protein